MQTIKIRINDEVTLKEHHPDKKLNINLAWRLMFGGCRVVVETTDIVDKSHYIYEYYVTVRTRSGYSMRLPISLINKKYSLRRDHKRICMHNKQLICD